jgi:VWFA-related protein
LSACGLRWTIAAPQAAPAQPAGAAQAPQQTEPQPAEPVSVPYTFRAQASDVVVPVTVTDMQGKFVSNLTKDDFRILDEGRPQLIRYFSAPQQQPVPMVVGFLVDLSNSAKTFWKTYQGALQELIWGLLPGDQKFSGYLISYSTDATLEVDTTRDGTKLTDRVAQLKPSGGAALYDAIYLACTRRIVVPGEPFDPRRVIVVIGDGHNDSGSHNMYEVLELAKRELVTIYGMSTVSYGADNEAQDILERVASETGGKVEYPLGPNLYKDIAGFMSKPMDAGNYVYEAGTGGYAGEVSRAIIQAVSNIEGNIVSQYVLRYVPDIDPGASEKVFRKIKVELPQYPNTRIYARDGYFPNPVPATPPVK